MRTINGTVIGRLASAAALACVLAAGCSGGSSSGGQAALVAGERISVGEVDRLTREWREAEAEQEHPDVWKPLPDKRLRQLAVLHLVRVKYVSQLAEAKGVGATAEEVARTASSEIDDDEFNGTGWGKGSFESAMRSSILSKALAEKMFPEIEIEEHKARSYFESHPELALPSWSAKVGMAFFRQKPTVPVAGGPGFERSARQAGAEEVIPEQEVDAKSPLPPELLEAISQMKTGAVSAALPAGQGHWVVSAIEVRNVGPRTYEEARDEIRRHLIDQERQARFTMWLTDELKTADIEVDKRYGSWPGDWL